MKYFSTTEEEDNDSDSEEESLKKNSEFHKLKLSEHKDLFANLQKTENQQARTQQENAQLTLTIQNQKIQQEDYRKKEGHLVQLQDEEWDWYDPKDTSNYFSFVTQHPVKKGEQVFFCYGRRTNKFLMLWYGFSFLQNAYDSVSFRLIQSWKTQPLQEYTVFTDYISYNDWEEEKFKYDGTVYKTDQFTKEFRIKKSGLCDDLITYIRMKALKTYTEKDYFNIKITVPVSIQYEIQALEIALKFLEQLQNHKQFATNLEQDTQLLEQSEIPWKTRFSVIFRKEQKEIIEINIQLVQLAISIIKDIHTGLRSFKESYMKQYPVEQELDEEQKRNNRQKIRDYLRQVYIGILMNKKKLY